MLLAGQDLTLAEFLKKHPTNTITDTMFSYPCYMPLALCESNFNPDTCIHRVYNWLWYAFILGLPFFCINQLYLISFKCCNSANWLDSKVWSYLTKCRIGCIGCPREALLLRYANAWPAVLQCSILS